MHDIIKSQRQILNQEVIHTLMHWQITSLIRMIPKNS